MSANWDYNKINMANLGIYGHEALVTDFYSPHIVSMKCLEHHTKSPKKS